MKISSKIVSVLLVGSLAGSAFGQVVSSDLARTSDWGKLSEAFTNNIDMLFTDSAHAFMSFTHGWDGSDPTTGTFALDPVVANPTGMSSELTFTLVPNMASITSEVAIPVSYLGNESIDRNWFGFVDASVGSTDVAGDGSNDLYNYYGVNNSGAPDDPTLVYSKPSNPDELTADAYPITVSFWHRDDGYASFAGMPLAMMDDTDRFYIFEAVDMVARDDGLWNKDTYYLITIDDRAKSLVDFDDGIFLTKTTMVVPEPSAIGLGAFALLLALGVTRRNRKA